MPNRLRNDAVAVQRVIVQRGAAVERIRANIPKRAVQHQHIKPGAIGKRAVLQHFQVFAGFKPDQRFNARKGIASDGLNRIRQLHRLQCRRLVKAVVNDSDGPLLQVDLGNGLMEFLILDRNQPTVHVNEVRLFIDINLGCVERLRTHVTDRSGDVHLFERLATVKAADADVGHGFGKGNPLQGRSRRKAGVSERFQRAPLGKRHRPEFRKVVESGISDGNNALSDNRFGQLTCSRKRALADGYHAVRNPDAGQGSAVESTLPDAPDVLADGDFRKGAAIGEAIRRYRGHARRNVDRFQFPAALKSGISDGGHAVRNGNGFQRRAVVKCTFRNGADVFTEDELFHIPVSLECVFADLGHRFAVVRRFNRDGSGGAAAPLDAVFGVSVEKLVDAAGLIVSVEIQSLGPIGCLVVLRAAGCPDANLIVSDLQIRKRIGGLTGGLAEDLFPFLVFHFHEIGTRKVHSFPGKLVVNVNFQRLRGLQPG